jgi:hypothetical protein
VIVEEVNPFDREPFLRGTLSTLPQERHRTRLPASDSPTMNSCPQVQRIAIIGVELCERAELADAVVAATGAARPASAAVPIGTERPHPEHFTFLPAR